MITIFYKYKQISKIFSLQFTKIKTLTISEAMVNQNCQLSQNGQWMLQQHQLKMNHLRIEQQK